MKWNITAENVFPNRVYIFKLISVLLQEQFKSTGIANRMLMFWGSVTP